MYQKKQLRNGLKIIVSPMPHMSSVTLGVWIGVGGRYESSRESGMSHLIEHMLFKGTKTRSAKDLKESIEGVGGVLNGFTADEVTCYMVKIPSIHLAMGLEILTDMVFNPGFDPDELAREKFVICEEIKMYRDQPAERVIELLAAVMWPDNSLGRPLTGTIKTVQSFRNGKVVSFKEKYYHPSNMAVIASGCVDIKAISGYVSGKYKGAKRKRPVFKTPRTGQRGFRCRFLSGDTSQTHIALGFHADGRNVRDRFAFKLLSVILGGNMSSRLFEELREKYGLCYDIASSYKRHSDVGEFVIHAGVDNKNTLRSLAAVLDELSKIRDMGVTGDELLRAKEYAKGQFLLAMENTYARMMWFGDRIMVDGHIPDENELLKTLDKVTVKDIKKACEKMFRSEMANLAVVGKLSVKDKNEMKKVVSKL